MLTTVASFCPTGTFQTITGEADSLAWIYKRVAKMCHIQIGGRHLVNAWEIKYDRESESPGIFYMRIKAAISENLLSREGKCHGVRQDAAETFSLMAESMIVLKWLEAINPALPKHTQETRAILFTNDKPNFADIQPELCELMDTLVQEIEQVDGISSLSIYDDKLVSSSRISFAKGKTTKYRPKSSIKSWNVNQQASFRTQTKSDKLCPQCKASGKDRSVFTTHNLDMCYDLYPEKRRSGGIGLLSLLVHVDENEQFDPEEAEAFFEAYRLNQGLACLDENNSNNSQ